MINSKLQVDFMIKSNKIVLFLNETKQLAERLPKAEIIYNKFKSEKNISQKKQHQTNADAGAMATAAYYNENDTKYEHMKNKFEILKLFELYGIAKKFINVIDLSKLKNSQLCEEYIRKFYCNDIAIKVNYFLIFSKLTKKFNENNLLKLNYYYFYNYY
jgi:hypothetical protein